MSSLRGTSLSHVGVAVEGPQRRPLTAPGPSRCRLPGFSAPLPKVRRSRSVSASCIGPRLRGCFTRAAYSHTYLGVDLVRGAASGQRAAHASALAQSALLTARLAFFDLAQPAVAARCYDVALTASKKAGDHTLAAAVLGHMAFVPGFRRDPDGARNLIVAALHHKGTRRRGTDLQARLTTQPRCAYTPGQATRPESRSETHTGPQPTDRRECAPTARAEPTPSPNQRPAPA